MTSRSDNHKDYFDDSAMAEYGRKSYKYKAIAKSKEKIRDSAVRIQAYLDIEHILEESENMNAALKELIEAASLE